MKAIDTQGSSWLGRMQEYIDVFGQPGSVLISGQIPTKVLDIRVQPGGVAAAQSLVDYGAANNMIVIIREFSGS